jgi:hypothetical protein
MTVHIMVLLAKDNEAHESPTMSVSGSGRTGTARRISWQSLSYPVASSLTAI